MLCRFEIMINADIFIANMNVKFKNLKNGIHLRS